MQHRWLLVSGGALTEILGGLAVAHPEWQALGYVMIAVGAAPLLYALLGPLWKLMTVATKRQPSWIGLTEAVEYLADRSVWVRNRQPMDATWVTAVRRDLLDVLGTGEVLARGRRPMTVSKTSLYGLEPIPCEFWPKAQFVPIAAFSSTDDKNKAWGTDGQNYSLSYVDVELRWSDLSARWKPLPFWERDKLTPFRFAAAVESTARKPVSIGHP